MNDLIPPKEINYAGHGDFVQIGHEFLQHFIQLGKLQSHERVLDVGCGVGRMAIPLTTYLNEHGSYEGFDVVPLGVKWCQQNITPRFPNFRFQVADIRNAAYNPHGRVSGEAYRFPFDDRSFDFVFLTSVFTHLIPAVMENYIAEIARVLKKEGRVFATFFLLNPEAEQLIDKDVSDFKFPYRHEQYWVENADCEEGVVGYKEAAVQELLSQYGFEVEGVHHGHWCGRKNHPLYQDIVVSRKTNDVEIPAHLRRQRRRDKLHPRAWLRRLFGRRQQPDIDPKTKAWYLPDAG